MRMGNSDGKKHTISPQPWTAQDNLATHKLLCERYTYSTYKTHKALEFEGLAVLEATEKQEALCLDGSRPV